MLMCMLCVYYSFVKSTGTQGLSCNFVSIFPGQEEDTLDREYGGLPTSFVYLSDTASDSERSSQLLDWADMDQVLHYS